MSVSGLIRFNVPICVSIGNALNQHLGRFMCHFMQRLNLTVSPRFWNGLIYQNWLCGIGRWLDKVKDDIKEKGLSADDVYDRVTWRRMSSYIDPT